MSTASLRTRKAFTLLELLIVVAGIGALMTVVMVMNSGATEGARAAKCKSHMRNLAQAVQSYAVSHEHYPVAGSYEYMGTGNTKGGKFEIRYGEAKGWIGWNEGSRGAHVNATKSNVKKDWNESCMNNTDDTKSGAYYAVTNGALWSLVHDVESYVCPEHRRISRTHNANPLWSYVMNAYFGYDYTRATKSASQWNHRIRYGHMTQAADRTLLFAEIPCVDVGAGEIFVSKRSSGDWLTDCTLQFYTDKNAKDSGGKKKCNTEKWDGQAEVIGFNHKSGKQRVAHVVFADSHVEELVLPSNPNVEALRRLTANLCNGIQVTYRNGVYVDPDGNSN